MAQKTIIIKGKGISSGNYLPQLNKERADGNDVELWTLNNDLCLETSVHFEIHVPPHHSDVLKKAIEDVEKYKNLKRIVVNGNARHHAAISVINVLDKNRGFVEFPIEQIRSISPYLLDINNSVSYMIAMACLEKPDRIFLPGVDFDRGDELRAKQKDNAEKWIFFAIGRGISVNFDESFSKLFNENKLYF